MAAAPAVAAAVPGDAAAAAPEPAAFRNERSLLLAGTFVRAPAGSSDCVILCHGYAGNRDDMALPDLAAALAAAGLNSLRFDFTGNGESEGTMRFANFEGEVADVAAAKSFLEKERGQRVVGLLGHSKGGDVVLLYAARHGNIPRVINLAGRFVMSEGLLTRFGADIMERLEKGPVEVVARRGDRGTINLTLTLEDVKERTALDIPGACAAIAARNSSTGSSSSGSVALLTIHGAEDSVIPPRDARMVSEAVPGSGLAIIEGADHNFTTPGPRAAMVEAAVAFFSAPLQ